MLIDKVRDHLNCLSKDETRAIMLLDACGTEMLALANTIERFHVEHIRAGYKARLLYDYDFERRVWTKGAWLFDLVRHGSTVSVLTGGCKHHQIKAFDGFECVVAPIIASAYHERGASSI